MPWTRNVLVQTYSALDQVVWYLFLCLSTVLFFSFFFVGLENCIIKVIGFEGVKELAISVTVSSVGSEI